ncbi:MAG: hypothetical protein ACNYPE_11255 [Candidatus Azotimanducaceae bacterium WSBS_2022_MAG_OTU7]
MRRDLTINAIARSSSGEISVDPLRQADIASKSLKHVSAALYNTRWVLRVARFYSRILPLWLYCSP